MLLRRRHVMSFFFFLIYDIEDMNMYKCSHFDFFLFFLFLRYHNVDRTLSSPENYAMKIKITFNAMAQQEK